MKKRLLTDKELKIRNKLKKLIKVLIAKELITKEDLE